MRRREFILALGGAAATPLLLRPRAARAQQRGPMPVIGYFSTQSRVRRAASGRAAPEPE
jgi:hypothetical protein